MEGLETAQKDPAKGGLKHQVSSPELAPLFALFFSLFLLGSLCFPLTMHFFFCWGPNSSQGVSVAN